MKWNEAEGPILYKTYKRSFEDSLQIRLLIDEREELIPYYMYIFKDLVYRLDNIESLKDRIQVVLDTYSDGADLIINRGAFDLAWGLGISTEEFYIPCREIPYSNDIFILAWSSALSSICTQIKLQYNNLLHPLPSLDCPCECGRGQTTKDFEEWTSNKVYPEDENYCGCGGR